MLSLTIFAEIYLEDDTYTHSANISALNISKGLPPSFSQHIKTSLSNKNNFVLCGYITYQVSRNIVKIRVILGFLDVR